jgi:hypothetical protein
MSGNVFTFNVDTSPMGNSLLHISRNVDSAKDAVLRSTEAIVEAEAAAAAKVSRNVAAGFHFLITSQIEQKKAAAKSSMDAKSAQLLGEKTAGGAMENQFTGDFNRIKNRYYKLFGSLNKALKMRIAELDKPVFQLVDVEYRQGMRKRMYSVGNVMLAGSEGTAVNSTLRISQIKGLMIKFMESIHAYLLRTQRTNREVSDMLNPASAPGIGELCLPFMVLETDGRNHGQRVWNLVAPEDTRSFSFHEKFKAGVNAIDHGQSTWSVPEKEHRALVGQFYFAELERSGLDERVAGQMKRLWDASEWETMRGTES